jgi:hypothetical protein
MHIDIDDPKTQYVIGGLIIAVMFVGWIVLSKSSGDSGANLTEQSGSDPIEKIIGRQLLASLERMKSVNLDTDFMQDSTYQSLSDLSVEVPELPKQRRDPFAPIGNDYLDSKTTKNNKTISR